MADAQLDARRRFAMIPEALLFDPSLPDGAVRVFGVLHRVGSTPDRCHPPIEQIAAMCGASATKVKRCLRALEAAGWVRRVERFTAKGVQAANGYELYQEPRLPGSNSQGVTGDRVVTDDPHEGVTDDRGRGADTTPTRGSHTTLQGVTDDRGRGSPVDPTRGSPATREREEPSTERPTSGTQTTPTGHDGPRSLSDAAAFEEFWTAYPHAVKRKAALAAWRWATRYTDAAEIVRGALAYAEYVIRTDEKEKFIEEPADWLTRQAWTDDRTPPRPSHWLDNMPNQGKLTVSPEALGLTWADMVDPDALRAVSGTSSA